jgi:drug/metabolite transporter (DMT)-like permease
MQATKSINRDMNPAEWSLLIILSILWGGSFFFSKVALAELPPFTVVLGRVSLAAIALNVILIVTGYRMPRSLSTWRSFMVMGTLNNLIPFSLIFWGQTQIASGLASILNATTPLWAVLLAHFFTTDEKLTLNRLSGVLLGLIGVVLIIGPAALRSLGLNFLAQVAVMGAALSYALAGIYGKHFQGIPPLVTATGQVTSTTVVMIPLVLLVDQPWTLSMPTLRTWGALLGLALLSTAIAYGIYFRLLASAGATNLLLVTFLIPASALLLGRTFLDERLDPIHFLGMAVIGGGLAAIDGRPLKMLKAQLKRFTAPAHVPSDGCNKSMTNPMACDPRSSRLAMSDQPPLDGAGGG